MHTAPLLVLCFSIHIINSQRQTVSGNKTDQISLLDQNEDMTWFLNQGLTNNLKVCNENLNILGTLPYKTINLQFELGTVLLNKYTAVI